MYIHIILICSVNSFIVFFCVVYAEDSGVPARQSAVSLSLKVQDENDNSPVFIHPPERLQIRHAYANIMDAAIRIICKDREWLKWKENSSITRSLILVFKNPQDKWKEKCYSKTLLNNENKAKKTLEHYTVLH